MNYINFSLYIIWSCLLLDFSWLH